MRIKSKKPKLSIGMPVYNGAKTLKKAINSILAQTFQDFELIISDNASNDETETICQKFASKDPRIHYIRQIKNIGAHANFNFLISKATEKYFMWAAADDWRSPDFLEVNISALESNVNFVASTSPNCFEGEEDKNHSYINFSLTGTLKERFIKFIQNAWNSHAIFYSVIRTEVIKNYEDLKLSYSGADRSFNFFLLSKGEINRSKKSLIIFGRDGLSMRKNPWKDFRKKKIEFFIPLLEFTKIALFLMKKLKHFEWIYVFIELLKINYQAMKSNYILTIKDLLGKKIL